MPVGMVRHAQDAAVRGGASPWRTCGPGTGLADPISFDRSIKIDDCLAFAKNFDRVGLETVIQPLLWARNEVVVRQER